MHNKKEREVFISKRINKFFKRLGPGFITGAADDDPSGIATYAQTGTLFGYQQLWTALFSLPFMIVVQEICARIGLVTGKGIAGVLRHHYSRSILLLSVFALFIVNTINIGTDLGAMAASAELIFHIPFPVLLVLLVTFSLFLEIFISYKTYAKYLKYLALTLLAYVAVIFFVAQDWTTIMRSAIVPGITFSKEYLMNIVAILGTTISPYLFFWNANEEVEEEVVYHKIRAMDIGKPVVRPSDIRHLKSDTAFGMFFSNFIMFFIILTFASTLHQAGIMNIETADQAAEALRPFGGDFTFILFAAGIIGAGLLAIPILAASASYAISEAFRWKAGLYRTFRGAPGFYGVIILATILGLTVNFLPFQPFTLLYYTAVLNGILAPPLLIMVMLISSNEKVMGRYKNSRGTNILGWTITIIMGVASIAFFFVL
jgi:NRAMP (natural resistance-associated macrophage protein)-like metal ion transporter